MTDTFYDIVMATLGEHLSVMPYHQLSTYLANLRERAEKWDELTKTLPSKSLLEKMNDCRVAESKLEAIKSLVEKGPSTDDWQDIDDLMGKLMNILESSEFTTKDEVNNETDL